MAKTSVTIDNLPKDVNQSFADRTKLLSDEELRKVTQTPGIANRAEAMIAIAKQDEASNLFGLAQRATFFEEPDDSSVVNVFAEKVIPSIGESKDNLDKLDSTKTKNTLEENQKKDLSGFFRDLDLKDNLAAYIKSKLNEFSKG